MRSYSQTLLFCSFVVLLSSAFAQTHFSSKDYATTRDGTLFADDELVNYGLLPSLIADASGDYEIANDTLIRIGQPSKVGITVMTNAAGNTDLQYNSDGTANEAGNTVIFAICDENGASTGRQINVNGVGRPRLISTSIASCTP